MRVSLVYGQLKARVARSLHSINFNGSRVRQNLVVRRNTRTHNQSFVIGSSVKRNFTRVSVRIRRISNEKFTSANPNEFRLQMNVHVILERKTAIDFETAKNGSFGQVEQHVDSRRNLD